MDQGFLINEPQKVNAQVSFEGNQILTSITKNFKKNLDEKMSLIFQSS
jgi:hypothetical protein